MTVECVQPLVTLYGRYEGTILQRLLRILHELERQQRMRQGEQLPAPAALDVSVHHDTGMQSDTMPLPQEESLGDKEDDAINRVTFPEPETEILDDPEVKD